jgi:hypothetical protein
MDELKRALGGSPSEDRRIVTQLTHFAAAAYERLQSFKAHDLVELSRMHLVSEPRKSA